MRLLVLSSTSIYPVDSHASLLQRETAAHASDPESPAGSLVEAVHHRVEVGIEGVEVTLTPREAGVLRWLEI